MTEFVYDGNGNVTNEFDWDSTKSATQPACAGTAQLTTNNAVWKHSGPYQQGNLTDAVDGNINHTYYITPNGQDSVYFSLGYQAGTSASPGSGQLRCVYYPNGGSANQVTVNGPMISIFDGTPRITSLTPNSVGQGSTPVAVTFHGTGFGLVAPSLIISPALTNSIMTGNSPTAFTALITPASFGSYSIVVQSGGNSPSGNFQAGGNPSSQNQSAPAQLNVAVPPTILIGPNATCGTGTNVAGTTQTVYVGQQITLTGCPATGAQVSSRTWSQPGGTAVGGYQASTAGGSVTPLPALSADGFTFYWVDTGNPRQMTYTDTLSSGQMVSATVTFSVIGPTAPNITAAVASVKILTIVGTPAMLLDGIMPPGASGTVGISLTATSNLPQNNAGAYSWAQLLSSDHINLLSNAGISQSCDTFIGGPVLDNKYPYGTPGANLFTKTVANDVVTDGPRITLGSNFVEESRSFLATMYLLWSAQLPNAIPVPLASITWSMTGDAINTLVTQPNNTNWALGCGQSASNPCHVSVPSADPGSGYPTWTQTYTNGALVCH